MSPTPDDYKCFIFGPSIILIYLVQRWYGRRLQLTWLNSLARLYRLYAMLCNTTCFTLALFLYLVARDVCSKTKTSVVNNILSLMATTPAPAAPAEIEEPASVNAQLLSWMTDDAEEAWKQKRESYDAKLQQIEDARAAFWASTGDEDSIADALETGDVATPF